MKTVVIQKQIQLSDRQIDYTLRVSGRARWVRMAVHNDGRVVVTVPRRFDQSLIERFILKKSGWVLGKVDHFKRISDAQLLRGAVPDYSHSKDEAIALAQERVKFFSDEYGFKFSKVSVRNQKTRWGSCSRRGNLSFNYRILFLPAEQRDYVVVHEVCHLEQFNHSRKFWDLVARATPNYLEIRRQLRGVGLAMP